MANLAPGQTSAPNQPYAIFRNRDFARYLGGRLVSIIGQQMLTVAVGWAPRV
mgnify:FL=1